MNKKIGITIAIVLIVLAGVGIYFWYNNNSTNQEKNNYKASRSATNTVPQNTVDNINSTNNATNENKTQSNEIAKNETKNITQNATQNSEEQLATFSTKIYNKDSARQNNIQITCNTLNDTIVKNGETFSFCNTVGQATTAKGYQKADIFDRNGNKKKGLGGGNCQISSTLYNAVLALPALEVTERHEHSNDVPYVKKGKDAAVAYGSYDFKFKNNSGKDLKILASTDGSSVTTTIMALSL